MQYKIKNLVLFVETNHYEKHQGKILSSADSNGILLIIGLHTLGEIGNVAR